MTKRTAYYDLAEMIANDIHGYWFCCDDLPKLQSKEFYNMFYPHLDGGSQFIEPLGYAWMGQCTSISTTQEDNEHRIIALLLMHEMEVNP